MDYVHGKIRKSIKTDFGKPDIELIKQNFKISIYMCLYMCSNK